MNTRRRFAAPFWGMLCLSALAGCKDQKPAVETAEQTPWKAPAPVLKVSAADLKPAKDPVQEAIYQFRLRTRQAYNNRNFDELEQQATQIRAGSETFGNGSAKIVQFYDSFDCRPDEPESMWELHAKIHQDWIAAKPQSVTALVAYADFLVDFAWRGRGSGYADSVTDEGWKLFRERVATARQQLQKASTLPEKDPMWGVIALRVALGQGIPKDEYDTLLAELQKQWPKFWGYDTARALSLLPRWHGEEGDWEAFAEQAAARPDGLGAEIYARIVMSLAGYYENVFADTKASWPKTREGLDLMFKKHPESLEIASFGALLATRADDRSFAKASFDRLGATYLARIWRSPKAFADAHTWAQEKQ